ncbi:DotA/TraY family protein [Shewanella sp. BF02_Schw]|uniref:DotA/TraY family protein n=1 Tax=Shewanella sp. BF02_Schw TaxID=394908 RepID=UPI00177EBC1A|nr:DotA/TraY family protein [Shewanella sp. BF02_Schw]MBO1897699.1 DotA/TraY family protein [Shewanella sp. BF02_Schw]
MKKQPTIILVLICLLFSGMTFAADTTNDIAINPAEKMAAEEPIANIVSASDAGQIPPGFYSGPAEGDLALEMYRQLLGDTALIATKYFENDQSSRATGGNITIITYMLSIMAVMGMIVGVILTAYWMLIGLVKTNVEGEFMGKKWNSYMVPLRSTFSIVGMLPMPGFGGLSFIQVMVLSIALFGVGVGGAVLKFTTERTVTAPIINSVKPDYMKFFVALLDSKICNESSIYNETYDSSYRSIKTMTRTYGIVELSENQPSYDKSVQKFAVGRDGICGTFEIELANTSSVTRLNPINNIKAQITHRMNSLLGNNLISLWNDFDQVIGTQGSDDWLFAYDAATDMNESIRSAKQSQLEAIYIRYMATIDTTIAEGLSLDAADGTTTRKFIDMVGQLGFAYTGSIHYPLLMRSSAIENAIHGFLPAITIDEPVSLWFWDDDVDAYKEFIKYSESIKYITKDWIKDRSTYDHFSAMEIMAQIQIGENTSQALSIVGNGTVSYISNMFRDIPGHPDPILEMAAMGRTIESAALVWFVLGSSVSGAAGATTAVPFFSAIGAFFTPFIGLLTTGFYMLMGLAFFYAEIIPAVPYIMWQIAIMGYFMYALATFFAAPMGFAMMNHPDGDDAFGKAGQGFEILVNLAIRPSLMVMGFFTGQALLKVMAWFINLTFFPTFDAISSNQGLGFMTGFGKLAIYGLLMLVAFYKSNSMTWELPSMIASMMGLNQTHRDMGEDEAQQKTLVMAGMLSSNITQLTASSAKAPEKTGGDKEKS